MPDYSHLRDPDALEARIRELVAEGLVSVGSEDSARAYLRRLASRPGRPPDMEFWNYEVGEAVFDALTEGVHVAYLECYEDSADADDSLDWEDGEEQEPALIDLIAAEFLDFWASPSGDGRRAPLSCFARLWLTNPGDLLPGHFTPV